MASQFAVACASASSAPKATRWRAWDDDADEGDAADFKPLSRAEAERWRQRHATPLVRRALMWQLGLWGLVALLAALAQWLWWPQHTSLALSVAYGGLCVVGPAALMAWGMAGGFRARWRASRVRPPRQALGAWLVWEGVKLVLALALLAAAPRLVSDVNWLGLVVGLVVVLKGYVLALWPASRR
ncbi:MAG: ATP synthase subunit I [Tepidimonas ignava]|uniref:ATP synthase I chain n=1 Tax=Tepidimonas ignava TaxID=114249 RepID=A0A4R3LG26_9BURK|nr:ATP synthase subunit I [Tepidimonas ignava]MCX7815871.1 ATP synthase subunit I [Tepidimonas ignava]TCS98408.1 ATP synthase protein I [Tepidimonas ignava]TSE19570.1 ATP synthase I chain [Tepidimonas ignava]